MSRLVRRLLGRHAVHLMLAGAAMLGTACTDLPAVELGVCGNHVIEPSAGEDCDGFATEARTSCRPPGVENQCRFECTTDPSASGPRCPDGMACGSDGLCRTASGSFVVAGTVGIEGARSLEVADLDGDGRDEAIVLQRTSIVAEYFDRAGRLDTSLTIPGSSETGVLPAVGRLSSTEHDDLAHGAGVGVVVALGNPERRAEYTAYPVITIGSGVSDVHVVPADVFPDLLGEEQLVIGTLNGSSGIVIADADSGHLTLLQLLPGAGSALAGELAKGVLGTGTASPPCETLVLSYKEATDLLLFTPCKRDGSGAVVLNQGGDPSHVALPAGAKVTRAATLADLNADGRLDLVIPAVIGSGSIIAVAYGVGDGTFHSDAGAIPTASGDEAASTYADIGAQRPLAVGDLDADGILDFVSETGVYIATKGSRVPLAPGDYTIQGDNLGPHWTEAVIADFNANGHLDVLAVDEDTLEIDFFNGTGSGLFMPAFVPTKGLPSHLTSGDFDGDLVQDLAFVQGPTAATSSAQDSLAILFGRPFGVPEAPAVMGRIGQAVQVARTRIAQQPNVVPSVDNLIVVAVAADGSSLFDGFGGEADRQIRASYVLTRTEGDPAVSLQVVRFVPTRLLLGDFDGDGQLDLSALAENAGQHRLWLVPGSGDGDFRTTEATQSDPLPTDVDFDHALVAAVDLDGDETDELVLFASPAGSAHEGTSYVARSVADSSAHKQWVIDEPVPQPFRFDQVVTRAGVLGAPLQIGDVDGDGKRDIVTPAFVDAAGKLLFYRNDSSGKLAKPVVVGGPEDSSGFALINANGKKGDEVAALSKGDVVLIGRTSAGGFSKASKPVASAAGSRLIAAGDFNGDGIDDLVVASDQTLTIFTGVPVLP